jgi:hypothetical protein
MIMLTKDEMEASGVTLGDHPSDGEVLCTGCWDNSDWDTNADNNIPAGAPIYYSEPSPEYGECNAYCEKCAREQADLRTWVEPSVSKAEVNHE